MKEHQHLLSVMREICPNIADDIESYWHKPITDYARYIGKNQKNFSSSISTKARDILFERIINHALNINPSIDKNLLKKSLAENAVCHSGLHCQLYIDNMNFNGMLLGLMSMLFNDNPFYFILNSALVTLQTSAGHGPAWIRCSKTYLKMVNLSSSKLKSSSVCCIKENVLQLENFAKHDLHEYEINGLKKIEGYISTIDNTPLSSALTQLNRVFIKSICGNKFVEPIIVDEFFCADLIIDHIKDENSFVYKLLFNPNKRNRLFDLFAKHKEEKFGNFLASGTDLFWGIGDKKIKSLRIHNNTLSSTDAETAILLDKHNITAALQSRSIVPNMFLYYLCLGFLPNIQVQGGTRMIVYLPLFKKIILELLDTSKEDELEYYNDLVDTYNFTWGARVIESTMPPIKFLGGFKSGSEFEELVNFYSTKSLKEVTQNLIMFENHPRWGAVLA